MRRIKHKGAEYLFSRIREGYVELVTSKGELRKFPIGEFNIPALMDPPSKKDLYITPGFLRFPDRPNTFLRELRKKRLEDIEAWKKRKKQGSVKTKKNKKKGNTRKTKRKGLTFKSLPPNVKKVLNTLPEDMRREQLKLLGIEE